MKVGFDVTWMSPDNKMGGSFQYALRVISALVENTDENIIAITGPAGSGIFDHLKGFRNFRTVVKDPASSIGAIIEEEKIDVVHTPMQYHSNYTLAVPMVTTLHDLQHFHYPDFFTEDDIRFRNIHYMKSALFSERVIVSFDHVKEDIVKFYHVPPDKIRVCSLGMPAPKGVDQSGFKEVRAKYNLPEKYLLYSANTWRHKNHMGLIKALHLVHERSGDKVSLVCTGQKTNDYFPELEKAVNEMNLGAFVHFTGYVPDEHLLLILTNASLVVIPTLYEAGSFPLMEAMVYEAPVICSNVTSLPDTLGDPRFVFDPGDVAGMADMIVAMLKDSNLIRENRENSKKRVSERNWASAVKQFLATYREALDLFRMKATNPGFNHWKESYDLCDILEDCETDRAARLEVINKLDGLLKECEADRAARLEVIQSQGKTIQSQGETIQSQGETIQSQGETIQSLQTFSQELQSSLSWRLTSPFRRLNAILRGDKDAK